MQPVLRLYYWLIFLVVNVLVSAATSLFVVQTFIQTVNRSTLTAQTAPAAPAVANTDNSTLVNQRADAQPTESDLSASSPPAAVNQAAPSSLSSGSQAQARLPAAPAPKVRITNVIYPGQRAREVVVLANEGEAVTLTGWTLSTPRGITYTFGDVVFLDNSFINLYTTSGVDMPTSLFWNQPEAVWQAGDVATLKQGDEVIATYTVR
jgi:cytoskeletal protein RodZ